MRHAVLAALLLLQSLSLYADDVVPIITAEHPISTPRLVPAAGVQMEPSVASDGDGFLAAWLDTRGSSNGTPHVRLTPLSRDGAPMVIQGTMVPGPQDVGDYRVIALWAGTHYALLWLRGLELMGIRVSREGELLDDAPRSLGPANWITAAAASGESILLLVRRGETADDGIVLDANLEVRSTVSVPAQSIAAAAPSGSGFLVVGMSLFPSSVPQFRMQSYRLSESGDLLDSPLNLYQNNDPNVGAWSMELITSGDEYVAVVMSDRLRALYIAKDGSLIRTVEIPEHVDYAPRSAWTGTNYSIAISSGTDARLVNYDRQGVQHPGQPLPVANSSALVDALSSSDSSTLILETTFNDRRDLYAARIDGAGGGQAVPSPVTFSPPSQSIKAVATNGELKLVVWTESDSLYGGSGSLKYGRLSPAGEPLDGPGVELVASIYTAASAVWTGSLFVVVWGDQDELHAVRITEAGSVLDNPPIVLAKQVQWDWGTAGGDHLALVAFTRRVLGDPNYLRNRLYAATVSDAGTVDESMIASFSNPLEFASSPSLSFNGDQFGVAFQFNTVLDPQPFCPVTCGLASSSAISMLRVASQGQAIDATPIAVTASDPAGNNVYAPGIAWTGANWAIAWSKSGDSIEGRRVSSSGTALDGGATAEPDILFPEGVPVELLFDGISLVSVRRTYPDGPKASIIHELPARLTPASLDAGIPFAPDAQLAATAIGGGHWVAAGSYFDASGVARGIVFEFSSAVQHRGRAIRR